MVLWHDQCVAHVLRAEASRKIQLRTMLRKLRNHLGNMKFHSGRVRVTPIYPNLNDTAQWVFPEDVEYLEGVVKENDMHVQSMDQA